MSQPPAAVPYASSLPEPSPVWKLFRLGLILWASVTLLRHLLYWSYNLISFPATGSAPFLRSLSLGGIECILLIFFLIAAIGSRRAMQRRFNVLGGLGGAFIAVVVVGALLDTFPGGIAPGSFLRVGWSLVAKVQILVFPLLCLIGMLRGMEEG